MERVPGRTLALGIVALVPPLSACRGAREGPASTTRDSAGIEIVESVRPAWDEGEGWTVGAEPLLRIGVTEGEAPYQFDGVTGALRLSDGAIVVADGASQEIRFFGADGHFLGTVGGRGEGPGEFSGLSGLGRGPAGALWAYDFSLRRITWLDPAGRTALRTTPLGPEPPMLDPLGALPDGSFVLRQLWGATATATATRPGLHRDPVAFVRVDSAGVLLDTVALVPGRELLLSNEGGRGVMTSPLIARTAVGTLRHGSIVIGTQDRFEVEERGPDGELLRREGVTGRDLSIGPDEVARIIQARLDLTSPDQRARMRTLLQAQPTPTTRPAYGAFLADAPGDLWISEWAPFPELPLRWTVLDPEGRWLGEVLMPAGFTPWDIGEDWILGVRRDEMDVERVELRPVVKERE